MFPLSSAVIAALFFFCVAGGVLTACLLPIALRDGPELGPKAGTEEMCEAVVKKGVLVRPFSP